MKTAGVVLAGGMSRRFGKPKAFAVHNEKLFYESVCEALHPHVSDIVVVAHPQQKQFGSYRVLEDDPDFLGKGPLAGLHSAMKSTSADWYCTMACDMPLMSKDTVSRLVKSVQMAGDFDAVVPEASGRLQPLAALYHRRTFEKLESLLTSDTLNVNAFLEEIKVQRLFGLDPQCFYNVNTQADYARLTEAMRQ